MAAKVGPKLTTSRKQGENGRCGTGACGRGSGGGRRRGRRVGGRCKEGKKRNRCKKLCLIVLYIFIEYH